MFLLSFFLNKLFLHVFTFSQFLQSYILTCLQSYSRTVLQSKIQKNSDILTSLHSYMLTCLRSDTFTLWFFEFVESFFWHVFSFFHFFIFPFFSFFHYFLHFSHFCIFSILCIFWIFFNRKNVLLAEQRLRFRVLVPINPWTFRMRQQVCVWTWNAVLLKVTMNDQKSDACREIQMVTSSRSERLNVNEEVEPPWWQMEYCGETERAPITTRFHEYARSTKFRSCQQRCHQMTLGAEITRRRCQGKICDETFQHVERRKPWVLCRRANSSFVQFGRGTGKKTCRIGQVTNNRVSRCFHCISPCGDERRNYTKMAADTLQSPVRIPRFAILERRCFRSSESPKTQTQQIDNSLYMDPGNFLQYVHENDELLSGDARLVRDMAEKVETTVPCEESPIFRPSWGHNWKLGSDSGPNKMEGKDSSRRVGTLIRASRTWTWRSAILSAHLLSKWQRKFWWPRSNSL